MNWRLDLLKAQTATAMLPPVAFWYILRLHVRHFLLVLGFLVLVAILGQYSNIARYQGGQNDFGNYDTLVLALLKTPALLQYILPHVMLVSAALVIYRLGARFELVVLMTARLPAWQLLMPLLFCGAMMGLIYSVIGSPLASFAYGLSDSEPGDEGNARRVVVVEKEGTSYVFADRVYANGRVLNGLSVFRLDDNHRLVRRIDADVAELTPQGWRLSGTRNTPADPTIKAENGESEQWLFEPDLMTTQLGSRFATPFYRLPATIAFAEKIGAQSRGYRLQLQWLIALPALLGSISFLAGSIVIQPLMMTRKWSSSAMKILLASFVFYCVTTILDAFSEKHLISAAFAAWLPPALCLLAATLLLTHKRI